MIDRRQQVARRARRPRASRCAMAPCPTAGRKFVDVEHRGRRVGEAEPLQSGERQQGRVDLAGVELAQPRLDIAAQRHDVEIRPQPLHHRLPPQRGGADDGAVRQLARGSSALRLMKASRTSSRGRHAGEHQPVRQHGRHVLGRMHREIDRAGEQRLLDLLGEQALAAGLRQRPVLDAVAAWCGSPRSRSRSASRPCAAASAGAHHARLRQRQRAAARADAAGWIASRDCSQCYAASQTLYRDEDKAQILCSRHRDDLRRDRRRGGRARRATAAAKSSPTSCCRRSASMPPYGGVVPEIAARAHVEALDHIVAKAMIEAGIDASRRSTASPPPPARA